MKKTSLLLLFSLIFLLVVAQNKEKVTKTKKTVKKEIKQSVKIEYLNVETFKKKITNYGPGTNDFKYLGKIPCIIDFYADWCRPCRMLSPELEKVAEKYQGKIIIYKIDTEREKELAGLFKVSSIPSILFIPIGKEPQMLRGYRDATQLAKEIEELLLKK